MVVAEAPRERIGSTWHSFEAWVGTRGSAAALFVAGLAVFAVQSVVLPAYPGRDMSRYVQAYLQLGWHDPIQPAVVNTRGPLASLGVGVPLELGGNAAEIWLALLYAASIVAWAAVSLRFGARAAVVTSAVLLVYPGYGILMHGLSSDSLFAAGFAGWALLLTRATLRPSTVAFLVTGLGMGALVLIRPANQVLIVLTLLPLLVRAPWERRLAWLAAYFIGAAAVTQSWAALAAWRYDDSVYLKPSRAVLAAALLLSVFLLPRMWRRRLALVAIPVAVVATAVAALAAPGVGNPVHYVRAAAQIPSGSVFLFRAFEIDPIIEPDNGPASREAARVVQRELLAEEPYASYGVGVQEFFSSGSDRIFGDFTGLSGIDFAEVTNEAIRRHRLTFARGVSDTLWSMMWSRRVYAPQGRADAAEPVGAESVGAEIVVGGRTLPAPNDKQPIPASRFGEGINARFGGVREVWLSASEHPLVFDDPRDERHWRDFGADTARLTSRLPAREGNAAAAHRLNQASSRFPPLAVWLVVGIAALAVRCPRHLLAASAPAAAALVVIVATSLVAFAVAHYAAPVSPAFVALAAIGLFGAHPRRRLRLPGRSP